jgi:predicted metal-dependent hydrolase
MTHTTSVAREKQPKLPIPRSPALHLASEQIPRAWFGGNTVATHIANGVNLLFPAGERFFVRSVHRFLPQVADPALRAQVKGFSGQEGRHAREHERFFRTLQAQGFEIERFLRFYEKASATIEAASPPILRLAVTAACEHFTALMAEDALGSGTLDDAHPTMRALFKWHAAEEIEHRAVAFDVLRTVMPNPVSNYAVRMAGLALATALLGGFWAMGTFWLLSQERASRGELFAEWRAAGDKGDVHTVFVRGIRDYVRPSFHPSQSDVDKLADAYLATAGLAGEA